MKDMTLVVAGLEGVALKLRTISPEQCRMARAALGLSREGLAKAAGVASATLADFERGKRSPYERTLRDVQAALEVAGVEFIEGGARLRTEKKK